MVQFENSVTVSGLLHFTSRKKDSKYIPFSIRHENPWSDGTMRKDFLSVRAFPDELKEKLESMKEGDPICVKGVLRSSRGSGDLYLAALEFCEPTAELQNSVKLAGCVHVVKAQQEGENALGKYVRFAVRQENHELDGNPRKDFLVVRVYGDEMRAVLEGKADGDPVEVEGTMRSSRGSGTNYVRCGSIK